MPIRLAWFKRRVNLGMARRERRVLPRLFLRTAQALEKQNRMKDFHICMYMHYLYTLTALPLIDEGALQYFDRMMAHAVESGNPDLVHKTRVMMHRVRANLTSNPVEAVEELQKSLEAILSTSDHFGQLEAEGSLALSKALITGKRAERQRLLAEATDRFVKAGEKTKTILALRMAAPFPVVVGAILRDLDSSLSTLGELGKKVQALVSSTGPALLFYHQSYLHERIKDVITILLRLGATRKKMTELAIRERRLRGKRERHRRQVSKRLQAVFTEQSRLHPQMKLDMESLYIFGNLVLDQWAHLIAYLVGLGSPEEFTFTSLVLLLQARDYNGVLKPLWDHHKPDILWLYYQLKFYRNIFVEHLNRPWQRGTTMSVYGEDFNLFIPTPPGWVDEAAMQRELEAIRHYAPRRLREAPDDYWEKKNLRRLLEVTFMQIDEIPDQAGRDKVWEVWSKVGGSTPSYEVIAYRLTRFLKESIPTMMGIVSSHPERVNLAGFRAPERRDGDQSK
jgi:hypothetical protein